MSEYLSLMDPLITLLKTLSPNFPPLEGFLDHVKSLVDKTKTYIEEENVEFGAEIGSGEQILGNLKKLIKFIEEYQAEL